MEMPLKSKDTSPFEIYQDPIDLYLDRVHLDKPLPPTPRKPSSVYSMHREDEVEVRQRRLQNGLLPTSVFLAPTTYRSSTSRLPDQTPNRPKLTREAQTHAASDSIIEWRRDQKEQRDASTHAHNLQHEWSVDAGSTATSEPVYSRNSSSAETNTAEQHADNYTSVLHTRSSFVPVLPTGEYHFTDQQVFSPMSPRITDVIDHSLVPAPLQFTSFEEGERPPSRFSTSSSEVESHHDGIRNSLRGAARKAFHLKKESKTTNESDYAAFDRFQERRGSTPRRQSRIGSLVSQRRASIQQSIAGMYDTLTSFATPTKSAKPPSVVTNGSGRVHKPRIRSPAIPLSPYQLQGPKVWETSSKASKKTARSDKARSEGVSHVSLLPQDKKSEIRFSTPIYNASLVQDEKRKNRSMVNKLASAFQSGTVQVESAVGLNTNRVKRTKSEKKRQVLKGKIKVIGLGEQSAGASGSQWL
ncbi:MAG: hypothetical protein Q9224_004675 [Gallowayella concinna]